MEKRKHNLLSKFMRRQDSTLSEGLNNMPNKPTKGPAKLSLNPEIGFGCTCIRKDFPHKGDPSCSLRGDGPFQVLECINDNAYKLDLPGEYTVRATFNITKLSPFDASDDLRINPFQEEGNNGSMAKEWSVDPLKIPLGPMTQARDKRFKEALHVLIRDAHVEEAHVFNSKKETNMVHIIKLNLDLD